MAVTGCEELRQLAQELRGEARELLALPYTGPTEERGAYIGLFPIVFDLVSAYGNVGLSLGYPGMNYSLAGAMSSLSKVPRGY